MKETNRVEVMERRFGVRKMVEGLSGLCVLMLDMEDNKIPYSLDMKIAIRNSIEELCKTISKTFD